MRLIHIAGILATVAACGEVVGPEGASGTPPTIAAITPDHGPVIGGATVTITGTHFQSDEETFVVVDDVVSPSTTVADDGTLQFELPPGAHEGALVDVTVFNGNGQAVLEDAFRYNERPVIISVDPKRGRGVGGTLVTITGRGFEELEAGTASVTIDGAAATGVTVVDDHTITATTGDNTSSIPFAPLDVEVSNANGAATLEEAFKVTLPGLILTQRQGSLLYYYHPPTGTLLELSRVGSGVGRTCAASTGSSILVVRYNPTSSLHQLASVDPLTGSVNAIGDLTDGSGNRSAGAIAIVGNTLYGISSRVAGTQAWAFMTINTSTGVPSVITGLSLTRISRAITAKDSTTLWHIDKLNETLDTIDIATGAITPGPALTGGVDQKVHGLATLDGELYVSDVGDQLWKVNTTSGALTKIVRVPFGIGGLCVTPSTF
jgi:hypothetical protein